MHLVVLGLNHKTAPVAVRECLSFSPDAVDAVLYQAGMCRDIQECVLLSTCNRTELYAVVAEAGESARAAMERLLVQTASAPVGTAAFFYYYGGEECIRHLFRVAASLDSLVIGEGQILSQVKKAYALAREKGCTGVVLNTLFNRAICVGKKVRTETRIAYNAVSVSYAAVELAKKVFGSLERSKILLLGAGQMSELTARHLLANGVQTVFVSNRNYDRAVLLAREFNGIAVPFQEFMRYAAQADIVITSTGAPHYIIKTMDVAHLMPRRAGRPIIFIDIAVPRDVEPEAAAIAGVRLFNIDDLESVVECNREEREKEAVEASRIIDEATAELVAKYRYLSFRPVVTGLADKADRIRSHLVRRAFAKLPGLDKRERRVVENLSRVLVRKLLRDPMIEVNAAAGTDQETYYLEAVRRLFKLDNAGDENNSAEKGCNWHAQQ